MTSVIFLKLDYSLPKVKVARNRKMLNLGMAVKSRKVKVLLWQSNTQFKMVDIFQNDSKNHPLSKQLSQNLFILKKEKEYHERKVRVAKICKELQDNKMLQTQDLRKNVLFESTHNLTYCPIAKVKFEI